MSVAAVEARRMPAPWGRSFHAARRASEDTIAGVRARPQRAGERRWSRAIVLGAIVVVGIALLLVWVRLQAVHTGYQLSAARHLAHRLEQEQRELELELATLTSPRRLELLARERLGMGPPTRGQIVSVP
ncbi:MAG: Cell division protein FtsL [Deltaproteobacteria bacterium]|nr:Cell division protein FtsL [Deltaproteobacteria bacterium]